MLQVCRGGARGEAATAGAVDGGTRVNGVRRGAAHSTAVSARLRYLRYARTLITGLYVVTEFFLEPR